MFRSLGLERFRSFGFVWVVGFAAGLPKRSSRTLGDPTSRLAQTEQGVRTRKRGVIIQRWLSGTGCRIFDLGCPLGSQGSGH